MPISGSVSCPLDRLGCASFNASYRRCCFRQCYNRPIQLAGKEILLKCRRPTEPEPATPRPRAPIPRNPRPTLALMRRGRPGRAEERILEPLALCPDNGLASGKTDAPSCIRLRSAGENASTPVWSAAEGITVAVSLASESSTSVSRYASSFLRLRRSQTQSSISRTRLSSEDLKLESL